MYYSKKKRAEMRKRKRKQQQKQHEEANLGDGSHQKSSQDITDGESINSKQKDMNSSDNNVSFPEGLSGKEARKFRKDARRKARAEGRDEASIRFFDSKGKEIKTGDEANTKNKKNKRDNGDSSQGITVEQDADTSSPPAKKQKRSNKAKSFPRINDLIAAHEEEQRRQKDKDSRKPVAEEEKRRYVALDCEMVGIGAGGKQSALARVSMTDWNHEVLLDTFVQVPDRVTDFRTHVSGVRAADIKANNDSAMELHSCRLKVGEMLKGKILVGHALKNDLTALMLDHPKADIRDTARYRPFMRPSGRGGGKMRPRKLRDLVKQHVGLDIQVQGEAHCSIDDAQATMKLYQFAKEEWDKELSSKKGSGGKTRRFKT